jgi:hypothetical protein
MARPTSVQCKTCGKPVTVGRSGPPTVFCSTRCRRHHLYATQTVIRRRRTAKGQLVELEYRWNGKGYRRQLGYDLAETEAQQRASALIAQIPHGQPPRRARGSRTPQPEDSRPLAAAPTDAERRFVIALVAGKTVEEAALTAGYAQASAIGGFGSRVLKRPRVQMLLHTQLAQSPDPMRPLRRKAAALIHVTAQTPQPPALTAEERLCYDAALVYLQGLVDVLTAARGFHGRFADVILDPIEGLKLEIQRFLWQANLDRQRARLPHPDQLALPLRGLEGLRPVEDEQERRFVMESAQARVLQSRTARQANRSGRH